MKDYNEIIGDVFKHHRKQKHFTQQHVADCMNVSKTMVHNWETGKRQMFAYQFMDLCKVLGLNPDEIVKEVIQRERDQG